jgi:hypothetical protein
MPPLACGPTEVFLPMTPREERRLPENRDAFFTVTNTKDVAKG